MNIAIRGFSGETRVFEEIVDGGIKGPEFEALVQSHMARLLPYAVHMIEIEFLDEPGPYRFVRFGTDPSGMVAPIAIGNLGKP